MSNPTWREMALLTTEERTAPYAHFYDRPAPAIDAGCLAVIEGGSDMSAADAVTDEKIGTMLHPQTIAVENGYCLLQDGTGYVAACHPMPGVSFEMYRFWINWWSREDIQTRYKIWCPGKHNAAFASYTSEEIGGKLEELYFGGSFTEDPTMIGLDREALAASTCVMADGGNILSKTYGAPAEAYPLCGVVCHFIYEEPGIPGIIMRSRFWFGCQARDGHITPTLAPGQRIERAFLHGLYEHNCLEMSYLRDLLPPLWQQQL